VSGLDLLTSQRACRRYAADPVPDTDLAAILEAATHAPSAENRQPWVFVVVRDPQVRAAVDDLTRRVGEGGARDLAAPAFVEAVDAFVGNGHGGQGGHGGYGGAPVLVVVASDGRDGSPPSLLASSVFPAVQNLLLAAAALGYGSTMATLAAAAPAELASVVGLPDGVRPFAVVPIGRPARPLGPPRRQPVTEVAHLDRFGTPFTA
jgi:nitroreductase